MENAGPVEASGAAGILEAGTRLGKYEIRRLIGLGSTSAIYEGARPDTGRRVAIKVLSPKRASVPAARARFLAEAKLTARVRHPHIVDVIEIGEDGAWIYLVMELLEGEDLGHRLRQSGSLSVAETADVLVPVCEAVAAAHESGVVHRDLKPSNIFLTIREQKTHPVVLDFGIAHDEGAADAAAGTVEDAGTDSGPRLLFGTPYYLSPEQVADHRTASPASDQWALGVILYECLTGVRPYDGDSLDDLVQAIGAGKALPPSLRRPGLSPELDRIVMRAMSSDPKGRFASVAELAQALRPFRSLGGETRPPSRRRPPSSPAIAAEASTQSPFTRTLTPEMDVLDGLWFEPEPAEESEDGTSENDTSLPARSPSGEASAAGAVRRLWSGAISAFASRWAAARLRALGHRALGRRTIAAVAGGALGGLALLFLMTHVGSARRGPMPGTATVEARAIEQGAGASAVPPVGPVTPPPAAPDPHTVSAPLGVTTSPATAKDLPVATTPSREREPEKEKESPALKEAALTKDPAAGTSLSAAREPKVPTPAVTVPAVTVKLPTRQEPTGRESTGKEPTGKDPTALETGARTPVTAAAIRSSTAERPLRGPRPPPEAPTATGAAARDVAERPRARTNPEVRMHNGVPLLD
jgi:serine/threonine-protein kinase